MRQKSKFPRFVLFLGATAGMVFVLNYFFDIEVDKNAPIIYGVSDVAYVKDGEYRLKFADDSAIRSFHIYVTDKQQTVEIKKGNGDKKKEIEVVINIPKLDVFFDKENTRLSIEVVDSSWWNFGFGNKTHKEVKIVFDDRAPKINIIKHSASLTKGGSALIVFEVNDEYLDPSSVRIATNYGKNFTPQVFIKDNFYISLFAWPVYENEFYGYIIAKDKAQNMTKVRIPIFKRKKNYRTSKIALSKKFLNGKISSLFDEFKETDADTNVQKFVYLNEGQRAKDEDNIMSLTQAVPDDDFTNFSIEPFYPLRNGAKVASFGDFRIFTKNKKQVSTSYHLGLDLASVRRADIVSNNKAKVVFTGDNGLYGNTVILGHSLGIYSLYSHLSRTYVNVGDSISYGKVIGKTGTTGLALGDHVHFGTLVQGMEVRPSEWLDKRWIENNILKVIEDAKAIVLR